MDDELVRNDRTYISTSLAAELTSYSQDYVGQLARDGHIESVKVGHKRFVGRDDLITYALDNKSSLSVSDIPDNHVPESVRDTDNEKPEEGEDADTETAADDLQSAEADEGEETESTQESIVLPDEEAYENRESRVTRSRQKSQRERGDVTETVNVSDRANKRWQKSSEGLRPHAEPQSPVEEGQKVPQVLAVLLALAVSFSLWVGPLSGADQTLSRVAVNISQASERAYHALGVGLDHQLQERGPIGTIRNSVKETSGLLAANIEQAVTSAGKAEGEQSSIQAEQVAAAGSTARSFTDRLTSLIPDTNWLTKPVAGSSSSFRDYQTAPLVAQTQSRISQAKTEQSSEDSSSVETQKLDRPDEGAVVVPAPSSTEARKEKRGQIRKQFSDPVEITASSSNSGVVQPQFGDREGGEYMYIMVPTQEGGGNQE